MMKNARQMFLSLTIVLTLLFSSSGSIQVYADDAAPTPETTEEAIIEEESSETPEESQGMEEETTEPAAETGEADPEETEPVETETPVNEGEENTPEATAEPSNPTTEPTEEATVEETIEATEEVEATEEPTAEPTPLPEEEPETLPELLESVPEGTDVIILNDEGEVEPLASEEAAETFVEGDPIWCPDGQAPTPGTNGCTPSFTSFSALIAELSTGSYTGDGTIWVAHDYAATEDNDTILFDGNDSNLSGISSNSLTIQGGWDGNSGSTALETPTSVSNIDVALVVDYWNGDVTMRNIFINNTTDNDAGVGLYIDTDGDVTLNNIEVSGTTGTLDPLDGDGAFIGASGNVQITDSTFDNNDGYGLQAVSAGELSLTNVTVNNNNFHGANLAGYSLVEMMNSNFEQNDGYGVDIASGNSITLSNVSASNNNDDGAYLTGVSFIELINSHFDQNDGYGLDIVSGDSITLNNVSVSNNYDDGAYLTGGSLVEVINSHFDENDGWGLDVLTAGSITITGTTANQNTDIGAYLDTFTNLGGDINITESEFSGNQYDGGLIIISGGSTYLNTVFANDNTTGPGIYIENGLYNPMASVEINSVLTTGNFFGLFLEQYADGEVNISNLDTRRNFIGSEIYAMDGAVNISSSVFTGNLFGGVLVDTYGDVNLNQVTAGSTIDSEGNGFIGMEIFSPYGKIFISSSNFSENGEVGLVITNQKSLTLIDVTANNNTYANLFVDAMYPSKTCYCPYNTATMTVNGGSFTDSDIGFEIYAYDSDKLVLGTGADEPYFNNNNTNIFYDLTEIPQCENCYCEKYEEPEGKPYKIVDVPDGGSGNIPQECGIYAGTILQLVDGSYVQISCPFTGFSSLKRISESELPGNLQSSEVLDIAILLGLLGEDGSYVINSDGTITITLNIPPDKRDHKHRMLFWDTTMNAGQGGWFEMPEHHFDGSIALHPDDPEDPRRIFSGVRLSRDTLTVTVNFAGYFLLVSD